MGEHEIIALYNNGANISCIIALEFRKTSPEDWSERVQNSIRLDFKSANGNNLEVKGI
jgi:hypothetical protein